MEPSVNNYAMNLVNYIMQTADQLRVKSIISHKGVKIIDMGIDAKGGFEAGMAMANVCLGGLGNVEITTMNYEEHYIPAIRVLTDYPTISTLGSQFAGWRVKTDDYFAMGSGPARALSRMPPELYDEIGYKDAWDKAVLCLESSEFPTESAIDKISENTRIPPNDIYILIAPTQSITGSVQISARVLETGIHKAYLVGLDPKKIISAIGVAPIAPLQPSQLKMMGSTNDAILYGGQVYLYIDWDDEDDKLKEITEKIPSSSSNMYGKLFVDIFKEAGKDLYKIDSNIFAPAQITINNINTGKTFQAGSINIDILKKSFELVWDAMWKI